MVPRRDDDTLHGLSPSKGPGMPGPDGPPSLPERARPRSPSMAVDLDVEQWSTADASDLYEV